MKDLLQSFVKQKPLDNMQLRLFRGLLLMGQMALSYTIEAS
jgi:hypothetical protein